MLILVSDCTMSGGGGNKTSHKRQYKATRKPGHVPTFLPTKKKKNKNKYEFLQSKRNAMCCYLFIYLFYRPLKLPHKFKNIATIVA